jgi:hypothetical protein
MNFRRACGWLLIALAPLLAATGGCHRNTSAPIASAQEKEDPTRAIGFKWAAEYYPTTNGIQRPKALLTGTEARYVTNGIVFVIHPRIESFREDGTLEWVATSIDAVVDMFAHTAAGTNTASFVTAETNLYLTGHGFLWLSTNSMLILSNHTYTWVDRNATRSRVKK